VNQPRCVQLGERTREVHGEGEGFGRGEGPLGQQRLQRLSRDILDRERWHRAGDERQRTRAAGKREPPEQLLLPAHEGE
jgi:hypothetical protein